MSTHYKALTRRTNPETIALFPLNGAVLFPGCELPLNVFEPRYLNMIDDALKKDRLIGMVQNGEDDTLSAIGGLGRIIQFSEMDDGRYLIVLKGLKRFRIIKELKTVTPYRQAKISFDEFASDANVHDTKNMPEAFLDKGGSDRAALTIAMKTLAKSLGVKIDWKTLADIPLPNLVDQAAMISPFKPQDKQSLLEATSTEDRRRLLIGLMHLYATVPNGDNNRPVQ
ncbi:MAG: LON peptidase substrate-binding domain-containing protein [Alphaproteobacteria bacterium]